MSSDKAYLVMRLEGPLQAWGCESQFTRRNTGLFPTKSAIAGICCAACGYNRGSQEEQEYLHRFCSLEMLTLAVPRFKGKDELRVRRLLDFHTVQGTRKASGAFNSNAVLTQRQYLQDASFSLLLGGAKALLQSTAEALKNPVWGIWLGRKNCIPTAPVFGGIYLAREEALQVLTGGQPLESFTQQVEVGNLKEGRDSLPDNPLSFASDSRDFYPRRIIIKDRKSSE